MDKKVARQDSQVLEEAAAPPSSAPLRVLHVISGLGLGGAETVLFRLVTHARDMHHEVVCLGPRDWYSDRLEQEGIRVHHIEFPSLAGGLAGARTLYRLIKSSSPDLVQGWMYRGNIVGGLCARIAGKPVVWNVRSSTLGPLRRRSRILARLGGPLAHWVPDYVINCSQESARLHARFGYDAVEGRTIPNGYDASHFRPDDRARAAVRQSLGIGPDTFVIGSIGRWHPQKGFPQLLEALRLLRERNTPVQLLMVGRDLDEENAELKQLVDQSGCGDCIRMIGERGDIADLARAPDLHVLASIGVEAFPNVVAETMLSGTPNVVTDVGDAAFIVGDSGWVVPPGDAPRLADAIQQAYGEWASSPDRWTRRREAARQRIADKFTIDAMVDAYQEVWRRIAANRDPVTRSDNLDAKTVAGFGREWDHFDQSKLVGEEYDELFSAYFGIFPFDELPPDAEGFDLGCGSGRWAAGVAPRVGRLHVIEPAEQALDVARKRLARFDNVSFHLAPADAIPLADASQDFGYSLGVLHHIPNPARALADAVRKLKPGAPFLLYIYYKLENRPAWFRFISHGAEAVRRVVSRLPFGLARGVTSAIAATVYWPLARLSLVTEKAGRDPSAIPLSAYRRRSFYTMRTDALDRFGTRLGHRFTRTEIEQMMRDAGLTGIQFSERMPYWVACGRRSQTGSSAAADASEVVVQEDAPLTILHVINSVALGGAETLLFRLVTGDTRNEHIVVSLRKEAWYSTALRESGIELHHLDMGSPRAVPRALARLNKIVRESRADVVQCWMYRSNLVGGLAAKRAGKPVVWGIHNGSVPELREAAASAALVRLTGLIARWNADHIINCSTRSEENHGRIGYRAAPGSVVHNGYDPADFSPDDEVRRATRTALGIGDEDFLIGSVSRWHPKKDIPNLLRSVRIARDRGVPLTCVLVGSGLKRNSSALEAAIQREGSADLVVPLGPRSDVIDIARALDVHALPSCSEAFPSVVAETMLSGTPNVATDVGDAEFMVGETGWIVPPRDPERLADALVEAYHEWKERPAEWETRRRACRKRIADNFSLARMAEAYETIWRGVART